MEGTEAVSMETEHTEVKKSRKRLKRLCSQIRQQMEFYFSDANLHKDRFIKKLIDQSTDGFIDLSVFASFNKLKSLTEDMKLVAKALSTSQMLEVSEDKLQVRRTRPLSDPKDVDDRTVYVECLPLSVTHDWVKSIFQACGKVVYVSLPRYKSTGDFKGFGFVEFETAEGAKKACEVLHNPPASTHDKLGRFPRSNKQLKQLETKVRTTKTDMPGEIRDPRLLKRGKRQRTVSESAASENLPRPRKRHRTTSEGSDSHPCEDLVIKAQSSEPKTKRFKSELKVDDVDSSDSSSDESEKEGTKENLVEHKEPDRQSTEQRKRKLSPDPEQITEQPRSVISPKKVRISEEVKVEIPVEKPEKGRSKRRSKKKKTKDEEEKTEIPELKVISKNEWSKLRQTYIQLQKSSMVHLKETLKDAKKDQAPQSQNKKTSAMETDQGKPETKERPKIEFTPNVIVKVTSQNEMTRKDVKTEASKLAEVAYVDIVDGRTDGYIRCHKEEEAAKLLQIKSDDITYTLVQDEEERQYWEKIHSDRDHTLNTKSKPKGRGRDKIFKKAERMKESNPQPRKHVIFEDN